MATIKVYLDSIEVGSTTFKPENVQSIEQVSLHKVIDAIDDLVGKDNWTSFEYSKEEAV